VGDSGMMMYGWSDMMVFGPFHWLFFIAVAAAVLYPIGRILSRMGFSPLWSVLAFVPFVNLVALWVLASIDWPEQRDRR
jgi:hypothetical protein